MLTGQAADYVEQTGVEAHFDHQVQQRQGQHHQDQHTFLAPWQGFLSLRSQCINALASEQRRARGAIRWSGVRLVTIRSPSWRSG